MEATSTRPTRTASIAVSTESAGAPEKVVGQKGSLSQEPADWQSVFGLLDKGRLEQQAMITNTILLARVVDNGIMVLARADGGMVKIVVEVNSAEKLRI